jgi:flagellar hook-basal body complex protein FliE
MPIPPVDPSLAVNGPEWGVGGIEPVEPATQDQSQGFGGMLSNAISNLEQTQVEGAGAAQALATGTATDPTEVVMAVERAQLSMQLASQIRNKAVEAYQDIFHTQV